MEMFETSACCLTGPVTLLLSELRSQTHHKPQETRRKKRAQQTVQSPVT